ncbi:MAG: NnrS family protein [Gammaproteobacteria bacterium]|jgi:uncharacterized protein involved in response to NO|nr:NnrS family protein [Gammaproteobacteria bacterium]MBT3724319.1 NnrS family protein [Gammaproteobacteria bacterium]MBT4193582.1 NnrS family protein [Gammaproteobacteria bacterium]MBT4452023.1 NnrS family protein [Gammaproteobacteria bacterium]MBT4862950.1 NnrS family protein [Gammaproteobacteria bacterium]
MSLLNIQDPPKNTPFSLFVLGFRPFFLAAGIFSIITMALWMANYSFGLSIPLEGLVNFHWHAHEMIYGFTLAIISGFLLTAIKNWTGVQTIRYRPLMLLFALWLGARLALLFGTQFIVVAAILDLSFNLMLFLAMLQPILKVKQWKQIGIISKILLLGIFNAFFYLGLLGYLDSGVYWGIYGGLFLLIAVVMNMGRRVMPFFIERGVGYPCQLKNSTFLDISSLVLFLALSIVEVFLQNALISSYIAAPLFIISVIRLYNWHTKGIWKSSLLWGLYGSFIFMAIAFLLFAVLPYTDMISRSIALHTLTVGGISLITVSMMSRVTLGHTGRSVTQPSALINVAQWLLLLGAITRVVLPVVLPGLYTSWILTSQLLWITGFAVFIWANYPLLTKPRIDGAEG